ncbi:hypothetical protein [Halarsenatibacter silvermanii]|uniref:Uncharacterized protein n=1 Tax=Halarsenatibacter silvermanii TaxID=321763 RepID=A0A1G9KT03_9FIRM|nr:hypothetical protein [Halarsenatibacter silvermanii]SDL52704.1 hypothetical protein SAMN04488692_10593 [Halarsenatibacter silvermanii]
MNFYSEDNDNSETENEDDTNEDDTNKEENEDELNIEYDKDGFVKPKSDSNKKSGPRIAMKIKTSLKTMGIAFLIILILLMTLRSEIINAEILLAIIIIVFLGSIITLIAGLVKPKIIKQKNRKQAFKKLGKVILMTFILIFITGGFLPQNVERKVEEAREYQEAGNYSEAADSYERALEYWDDDEDYSFSREEIEGEIETINKEHIVEVNLGVAQGEREITPSSGTHKFYENENIEIEAEPEDEWELDVWKIGEEEIDSDEAILEEVKEDKAVKARFSRQEEEVTAEEEAEDEIENIIQSEKGFAEMGEYIDLYPEQDIFYSIFGDETGFKEPLVKKWNYTLENIQDDMDDIDSAKYSDDWWSNIELDTSDIEPRNAPGWDGIDGDIYDIDFGTGIDLFIANPPTSEATEDDPNTNKFRISVGLEENLSSTNSTNEFLSRRHFAVQTMDVALRAVLGEGNYNREELYDFVSDFENGQWNISKIDLDFNYDDWGYYKERFYDDYEIGDYDVGIEVDETGDFESYFSTIIDFEL